MTIDPVSIGITVALTAAQYALTASQKIEGPRLDSLEVSVADYGTPKNYFLGAKRLEGLPLVWADKLHETKKTTKGKGPKQTTYKYDATFGGSIAAHPIDAVTRIWLDKKLVFDATGAGPMSPVIATVGNFGDPGGAKAGRGNVLIMTGAEDQLPAPAYAAWCEDKHGPDSAPAFRGEATFWVTKLPLEPYGNRIPSIDMEAVRASAPVYPYESRPTASGGLDSQFAINGTWMIYTGVGGTNIEWWDLPTRTKVGFSTAGGGYPFLDSNVVLGPDGTAHWFGPATTGIGLDVGMFYFSCPVGGATAAVLIDDAIDVVDNTPARFVNGKAYCGHKNPGYLVGPAFVATVQCARDFFAGPDGDAWALFEPDSASNEFTLRNLDGGDQGTFTGLVTRSVVGSPKACWVPSRNEFFVCADGKWYQIDAETMTITSSGVAAWGEADVLPKAPGPTSFWQGTSEYSLIDGTLLRTISVSDWVSEAASPNIHDPINNAFLARNGAGTNLTWRYLGRIGGADVTLGSIVNTVATMGGNPSIDVSELTQPIAGFSWARGAGSDIVAAPIDIHDSDLCPHGFGIKGRVRGGAAGATIPAADFVRESGSRFEAPIVQDTELPLRMTFNYADAGKDDQPNTAVAQRYADAVDSQRSILIDLKTYRTTPDEAQGLADRNLRRRWASREEISLELALGHALIAPGDVRTLDLDGVQHIARAVSVTRSGIGLKVKWKRDDPRIHTLNGAPGPTMDGRDEQTIYIPPPSRTWVMDIPFLRDAENSPNPLLHFGAGGYLPDGWAGVQIYEQDPDDGTLEAWQAVEAGDEGVWGTAGGVLGSADPWLWDRGNTLNVVFFGSDRPSSVSEAAIDADPTLNQAVIGAPGRWEIVNFTTASLQGDGSYNLSGFKRGRRGTEWAMGLHQAGDLVVMAAELDSDGQGLDEVGLSETFRGETLGRDPEAAAAIVVDFAGQSLKPYAPARIVWTTDGTDMTGTIVRRTRVGGAWIGGTPIPLSEASEAYEVEIYHGAVLKRTIAVGGTNVFTYTGAMIAADGNAVGVSPPVKAYQLSDAVGRGFALAA